MKELPVIKEIIENGYFVGDNKPSARVTVEPYWQLHSTDDQYGGAQRGPYRWFQSVDGEAWEVEVPNIKMVDWSRSIDQPIGTCNISMYNQWHQDANEVPELATTLGQPGYFWFDRGSETDPESIQVSRWNQSIAVGAKDKDGEDVLDDGQPFSWQNVLVPNALIRTYEGYGGQDLSINAAVAAGKITKTGTWLVDRITASTDGVLRIECRDVGRLLQDQRLFPPLVPSHLYPLEYQPPGSPGWDSPWQPVPQTAGGVQPYQAMMAFVPLSYMSSSIAVRMGDSDTSNSVVDGHYVNQCFDGNEDTWAWSPATAGPKDHVDYWQFATRTGLGYDCNQITIKPYGGGYTMYVSVSTDGSTWVANGLGTQIPVGSEASGLDGATAINYVAKFPVPKAVPGEERTITYDLPTTYDMTHLRLTFRYHDLTEGGYRVGLRDVMAMNTYAYLGAQLHSLTSLDFATDIASHCYSGWWACSNLGKVWTSHDLPTPNADPTKGPVNYGNAAEVPSNPVIAIAAHPDGTGYMLLRADGDIHFFGDAPDYGMVNEFGYNPSSGPLGAYSLKATGITYNHDGTGYWVIYSNGVVHGFGSVGGLTYTVLPESAENIFMEAYTTGWPMRWLQKRGTAIASHPTKMGFWATDGNGRVWAYGECQHHGEYVHRTYASGSANQFTLSYNGEYVDTIEPTSTGDGYWLISGSGRIGQFGDAVGRGPIDLYAGRRNNSVPINPYEQPSPEVLKSLYRSLFQGICRMSGDAGFYVVVGGGDVAAYSNDWWGNPGFWGKGGYKWHEGLYDDYADIWNELLAWSGFTLGPPGGASLPPGGWGAEPDDMPIHGAIESTGINADSKISLAQLDKKTVLDVITMLKEVVGYVMFINDEGGVHIESPNWWKSGNFITTGSSRIWTSEIPVIDERLTMLNYSATMEADVILYEIITGSTEPLFSDPTRTSFYRFNPPNFTSVIKEGWSNVSLSRNIVKTMSFGNAVFTSAEEQKLMAELIALHAFFAQRTGSATIVGDPSIQINDQVKFIERNTAEAYIHYVRSVKSNIDLDSGAYTMNLSTNWLGTDDDNWVITRDNVVDPLTRVAISERLDAWQTIAGHGFESGQLGTGVVADRLTLVLNNPVAVMVDEEWEWTGTLIVGGATVTAVQISLEGYTDSVLGEFVLTIDGTDYDYTYLGHTETIGELDVGAYAITMTGTALAPGNGNLTLRASGAGSSVASGSLFVSSTDGSGTSSGNVPTVEITAPIGATPTPFEVDEEITFTAESNTYQVIYEWSFEEVGGDTTTDTGPSVVQSFDHAGTWQVTVEVTDVESSETATDSITITVEEV